MYINIKINLTFIYQVIKFNMETAETKKVYWGDVLNCKAELFMQRQSK